jgi:hypothetical protein
MQNGIPPNSDRNLVLRHPERWSLEAANFLAVTSWGSLHDLNNVSHMTKIRTILPTYLPTYLLLGMTFRLELMITRRRRKKTSSHQRSSRVHEFESRLRRHKGAIQIWHGIFLFSSIRQTISLLTLNRLCLSPNGRRRLSERCHRFMTIRHGS